MQLREFFKKQLEGVGFADLNIQKTPLGTRVTIQAARPGLVIGKKGSNVKMLTEILAQDYNIENPQIDVEEVETPELNAQIMAERLASALEKGQHYRRAGYGLLRRIMRTGAKGCEIIISGKITSQRARYQKMKQGVIIKCGEPVRSISYGIAHAKLKAGILGIRVKILPPDNYNPKAIKYIGKEGLDPDLRERLRADEVAELEGAVEEVPGEEIEEEDLLDAEKTKEIAEKAIEKLKFKGEIADDELLMEDDEEVLEDEDEDEISTDEELAEDIAEAATIEEEILETDDGQVKVQVEVAESGKEICPYCSKEFKDVNKHLSKNKKCREAHEQQASS